MGSPLGDFIRAKRDSIQPESLGLPERGRRRSPGVRRLDLAARAGISVEYLTRIEQGRDRNPSTAIVNALADALSLAPSERNHLRYLAKITGAECSAHIRPTPPHRGVRPSVLKTLRLLEPGIAIVTNRLGDVLAHTSGYESVASGTGLLDADPPNLTRLLSAAEHADGRVIELSDVGGVSRPRRRGAGRGLVVGVARWSSGCRRGRWGYSAVTSATAARVEDSSTMALSAANAATSAWTARLLTARG
jgi:transcriptional regulator with XRE-family HTH domain